jgi:hypothetical protein
VEILTKASCLPDRNPDRCTPGTELGSEEMGAGVALSISAVIQVIEHMFAHLSVFSRNQGMNHMLGAHISCRLI